MSNFRTRGKINNRIVFSLSEKKQIHKKSKGRCSHCGRNIQIGDSFTIEHVIPLSRGGSNNIKNLVGLCKTCNNKKQDMIYQPHLYYRYLTKRYSDEIQSLYKEYESSTYSLSDRNFIYSDVFEVESKVSLLAPLGKKVDGRSRGSGVAPQQYKRGKSRSVDIKVKFKKGMYSDLDDIVEYMQSIPEFKDFTKSEIECCVSNTFTNGAIYIHRAGLKISMAVFVFMCYKNKIYCDVERTVPTLVIISIVDIHKMSDAAKFCMTRLFVELGKGVISSIQKIDKSVCAVDVTYLSISKSESSKIKESIQYTKQGKPIIDKYRLKYAKDQGLVSSQAQKVFVNLDDFLVTDVKWASRDKMNEELGIYKIAECVEGYCDLSYMYGVFSMFLKGKDKDELKKEYEKFFNEKAIEVVKEPEKKKVLNFGFGSINIDDVIVPDSLPKDTFIPVFVRSQQKQGVFKPLEVDPHGVLKRDYYLYHFYKNSGKKEVTCIYS